MTISRTYDLELVPDARPLKQFLETIQGHLDSGLLSTAQGERISVEVRKEPAKFIRLDPDPVPAPGTGECRVTFKPTDRFLELVAAMTGDREHNIVKDTSHFNAPQKPRV